jgi:hypothetical protein
MKNSHLRSSWELLEFGETEVARQLILCIIGSVYGLERRLMASIAAQVYPFIATVGFLASMLWSQIQIFEI